MEINKSFICCITSNFFSNEYLALLNEISKEFGQVEEFLNTTSWFAPANYLKEMGGNLQTEIIVLSKRLSMMDFVKLKKFCMFLEHLYSVDNRRLFNLNPGYIINPASKYIKIFCIFVVWKESISENYRILCSKRCAELPYA